MKVLEAQSALVTNYEMAQFVEDQRNRYAAEVSTLTGKKRCGPDKMEGIVRRVDSYLRTFPNPLHETDPDCPETYDPSQYTDEAIQDITARLKPYGLTKGEVLMIINLRPENRPILSVVIEEIESRLTDEQQGEILAIIKDVLGCFSLALREYYRGGTNQQQQEEEEQ